MKRRIALTLVAATVLFAPVATARVLLTVDEALALAFPGATIERRTIFLDADQLAQATELAGEAPATAIVHPYEARRDGRLVATAYFDSHVVRTLSETVMVAVDPEIRVVRVEVLAFDEPPDYLPRAPWYRQFDGRPLDDALELGRAIRPVSGATLTTRATARAVRRALAAHRVLTEVAPPRREEP